MKFLLLLFAPLFFFASCTIVTSNNMPGKAAKTFPKNLIGKYDLKYPSSMESMMEGAELTSTVTISKDQIEIVSGEQVTKMMINDSVFYSKVGKQGYLSLGTAPNFTVLRVVPGKSEIQLFTMNATGEVTVENLRPFFKEVVEEKDLDENGTETISMRVTLDDQKLDAYFKSDFVDKDPFKLVRKK